MKKYRDIKGRRKVSNEVIYKRRDTQQSKEEHNRFFSFQFNFLSISLALLSSRSLPSSETLQAITSTTTSTATRKWTAWRTWHPFSCGSSFWSSSCKTFVLKQEKRLRILSSSLMLEVDVKDGRRQLLSSVSRSIDPSKCIVERDVVILFLLMLWIFDVSVK